MYIKEYQITENGIVYTVKECSSGHTYWYLNGNFHRENGPAIIDCYGNTYWYINGHLHRDDGPAIEQSNGDKWWWFNDRRIECFSQQEFEKFKKLKSFW